MDELFNAVLKGIAWFVRITVQFFIIDFIAYGVGYVTCKSLTLGRFPSGEKTEADKTKVAVVGGVIIALVLLAIASYNSMS
ncbi:hypothetical protein [Vibrio sp. SCSIO 43136]|uniref:hypothetical protein n=1 Tax=Vibrio sp. SCSIO 43136 TaxID=2819101 RepID=UPI0020757B40|nr:hypothetical protein [Vibrio sp. SCSIO 43136]USD64059.1 hypothetical protein J4N39_07950 [Vibrio sp. SCSIO 43136]